MTPNLKFKYVEEQDNRIEFRFKSSLWGRHFKFFHIKIMTSITALAFINPFLLVNFVHENLDKNDTLKITFFPLVLNAA